MVGAERGEDPGGVGATRLSSRAQRGIYCAIPEVDCRVWVEGARSGELGGAVASQPRGRKGSERSLRGARAAPHRLRQAPPPLPSARPPTPPPPPPTPDPRPPDRPTPDPRPPDRPTPDPYSTYCA